ncbi:hypothetical protein K437DRAFT_246995 [Tilletiaria anomala UBC 951]|uniref:Single hybrid motif-containing protein n=1 Tax=Tilletiaria anomala (strain ATCC 24038 / CBS 436.72 / UBC 951) TaxID=1037660 RepID=A0A066VZQ5_TILAU|nr:uncharacterized protein K437DRAFT_246995 [Tilletiaria anomala UBC 951]KDN45768.1 hypothetical protein K437DRAFT_246995 [Tilletiaria anomala UBC 951]
MAARSFTSLLRQLSQSGCCLSLHHGPSCAVRGFASTSQRHVITKFAMPAMSPTMTEGGIANWKVKEGSKFSAGDVLLEIETDKATMDVEAQEDGVLGKIIIQNGAKDVKVGKTIALLAEEGDDISNLEAPAEDSSLAEMPVSKDEHDSTDRSSSSSLAQSSSQPTQPSAPASSSASHAALQITGPIFPSVARLLAENHVSSSDALSIKGTGVRGMLTKGDVLAFLGKVNSPNGSFKPAKAGVAALGPVPGFSVGSVAASKPADSKPLSADDLRSLILGGLASASHSARAKQASSIAVCLVSHGKSRAGAGFDALLASYSFGSTASQKKAPAVQGAKMDPFKGLL